MRCRLLKLLCCFAFLMCLSQTLIQYYKTFQACCFHQLVVAVRESSLSYSYSPFILAVDRQNFQFLGPSVTRFCIAEVPSCRTSLHCPKNHSNVSSSTKLPMRPSQAHLYACNSPLSIQLHSFPKSLFFFKSSYPRLLHDLGSSHALASFKLCTQTE